MKLDPSTPKGNSERKRYRTPAEKLSRQTAIAESRQRANQWAYNRRARNYDIPCQIPVASATTLDTNQVNQ